MSPKPILITGSPRSGTTWVGRMLAASRKLYYIHEPFNPNFSPGRGICNVKFNHHQTYITERNETIYYEPIKQMLKGRYNLVAGILECRSIKDIIRVWHQKKRFMQYRVLHTLPLIKDPVAAMSAGWLGRRFDVNVIVMVRHPAAVVASMKRLGWSFEPLNWALSQPLLMRDYLFPFEKELKLLQDSEADIIDRTALLWKVIYFVFNKYRSDFPSWIYLRHEDISRDPLNQFERLYKKLDLDFTHKVKEKIEEFSNEDNPICASGSEKLLKMNSKMTVSNWKNMLSILEVNRIRDRVEEVSNYYYSESDWDMRDRP